VSKILVTGGAGFIGSHLVDRLVDEGHEVRILDGLAPQVHGAAGLPPPYLNPRAEFVLGDVRNPEDSRRAIDGVEIVFHEAAAVGVGQSMYDIREYVSVNSLGGATLLEAIVNARTTVRKVVVASSMSIYGEGEYDCPNCGRVYPGLRPTEQLGLRQWEMRCPNCQAELSPLPTSESKPLMPTSIYAITKRDHEEMFLSVGRAYGIPTVALRYFNAYGPRQALSNPYTGIIAIFSSRILNHHPPLIFEDGLQSRDFTHVSDIVQANLLAMDCKAANYEVFNVGTGRSLSVLQVAQVLAQRLGFRGEIEANNTFRAGDIRHCYADISKISCRLGYRPTAVFEDGIDNVAAWVRGQTSEDRVDAAHRELVARGLVS
jgi:dTDP-L-rhamnose 4-epimerase